MSLKDSPEKIYEFVEKKCFSIEKGLLQFDPKMEAREIRELILRLVAYISYFNELHAKAKYKSAISKRKLEFIKTEALKSINSDPILSKLAVSLKEQYAETYQVKIGDDILSYNNEAGIYDAYIYATDRFGSCFEDIKIAIMACQSVLSFDREEMKNLVS